MLRSASDCLLCVGGLIVSGPGAAGGGEEASRERRAAARRAMVRRLQTRAPLAEEDRRDPRLGVLQDQEHLLSLYQITPRPKQT